MNTLAMLFLNSRETGSPNSELYAPTGTGTAPGSPFDASDFWTIYGGTGSAPASIPLRPILEDIFAPGPGDSDDAQLRPRQPRSFSST